MSWEEIREKVLVRSDSSFDWFVILSFIWILSMIFNYLLLSLLFMSFVFFMESEDMRW
jgi:hypothetical protein